MDITDLLQKFLNNEITAHEFAQQLTALKAANQ